jgi:hypothetical protein
VVGLVDEVSGEQLLEVVPGRILGVAKRTSVHLDQPYQPVVLEGEEPEKKHRQQKFMDGGFFLHFLHRLEKV